MNLDRVVFLAANTARSQCYAQALQARGLRPSHVILFDANDATVGKSRVAHVASGSGASVFLPDLGVPLLETCKSFGAPLQQVIAGNVNDALVIDAVRALEPAPELIIYSGFGGQIVRAELLGLGVPLLHIHAGYLPDYRGSTTLYYSILTGEGRCGCSAILLAPQIDQGPILARRWYPLPPAEVDLDYVYDGAIRADLLVDVLETWAKTRSFEHAAEQRSDTGRTYYVIHPVLKHIAMLALAEQRTRR